MKTEIIKIKGSWEDVVNRCRATVGKSELGKEPSQSFKRRILLSEHSPIREMHISWVWRGIKYWVAMHWKTHIWPGFVRTQRTDRTGVNRDDLPQSAPVEFLGEANPQHTIDTWRKRLCYQASPETREHAEDFKVTLRGPEPEWSDVLVPNCVYRCGCPELQSCGYWDKLVRDTGGAIVTPDIQERYDLYNFRFYLDRGGDKEGKN